MAVAAVVLAAVFVASLAVFFVWAFRHRDDLRANGPTREEVNDRLRATVNGRARRWDAGRDGESVRRHEHP